MKYCVTTYSFSSCINKTKCNYFEICDLVKEMGFDGIEFIDLDKWDKEIDKVKTAKEIKEYCDKIGLEIVSYTVSGELLNTVPEVEIARLKSCVDIAEILGVKVMRHDICYPLKKEPLYTYKNAIKEIAPRIREITEYAYTKGIKTCVENHGFIFQAPERVEELILEVNHPNYGWLCDLGNFLCDDVDPIKGVSIAAPYTFHVHAKDFLFKSGNLPSIPGFGLVTNGGNYLRGTIIGHGVVPVKACVNALKKAGYDNYISVEFEGLEENLDAIKKGLEFLKSI